MKAQFKERRECTWPLSDTMPGPQDDDVKLAVRQYMLENTATLDDTQGRAIEAMIRRNHPQIAYNVGKRYRALVKGSPTPWRRSWH